MVGMQAKLHVALRDRELLWLAAIICISIDLWWLLEIVGTYAAW